MAFSLPALLYPQVDYSENGAAYKRNIDTRQDNNATTPPSGLKACETSFCPEAIANVTAVGIALIFLTVVACSLWHYQVQQVRLSRIRQALDRNKAVDRHLQRVSQSDRERQEREQRQELLFSQSAAVPAATRDQADDPTPTAKITTEVEVHKV